MFSHNPLVNYSFSFNLSLAPTFQVLSNQIRPKRVRVELSIGALVELPGAIDKFVLIGVTSVSQVFDLINVYGYTSTIYPIMNISPLSFNDKTIPNRVVVYIEGGKVMVKNNCDTSQNYTYLIF